MDEFSGGRTLVYKSASIVERRRRILSETRKMIAETGIAGFNIRELCARAGVAQKTLYNAFGGKENVISMAIREYLADFEKRVIYARQPTTLTGRLERLIKVHSRNVQIRPYTSAIMSVYNSPTADPEIRRAIREVAEQSLQPYAEALRRRRQLDPETTVSAFIQMYVTTQYAVLTDWCVGDMADDALVRRICEVFLVVLASATVGATQREARTWLRSLRSEDAAWRALYEEAAFRPADLHARGGPGKGQGQVQAHVSARR